MDRHRVGIVIPAWNERSTITSVVERAAPYGVPIVVDDGSTDDTAGLASAAGAQVVRHTQNRGYDEALNSGFACAEKLDCTYVLTMDADGQHDPYVISTFLQALEGGADLAIGVRDRRQRIAEHVFAWVGAFKWDILDPLCGMKAYRMSLYRELGYFDSYASVGTELAIFAARKEKIIVNIPVKTSNRMDSPRFGRRYSANKRIMHALVGALGGVRKRKA